MKPLPLFLLLLAFALPACTTRYSTPSRALGTSVSAIVDHDVADRVLRVEVEAGSFPVRELSLVDARGGVRKPDSVVREGPELRGGVRLGGGIGTGLGGGLGGGGIGIGTGVSRTVGGRLVPGPFIARFLDPPATRQPWTLRVVTGEEAASAVTTPVLLAELKNRDEVEGDRETPLRLKLPSGETRSYRPSRGENGATLYQPVDAAEPGDR